MPIPRILILKGKDTGSPGVYVLINGATVEQIGNDFGALENINDNATNPKDRVMVFRGEKYAYQDTTIHKENEGGTGNWGAVFTMSAQSTSDYHTGLYHILINNQPAIVCAYIDVTGALRGVYSFDGTTWVESGSLSANLIVGAYGNALVFKEKLFWWTNGSIFKIVVYSPVADTVDSLVLPVDSGTSNADFAIHNNNLYLLHTEGTTATDIYILRKYQGGTFISIYDFTGVVMGANGERGCCVAFSDGTDLIAITVGGNGDQAWRIQNPGESGQAVTEITANVIPAIFQSGGGAETECGRWSMYVDNTTDSASPEIYLFRLYGGTSGQAGVYTCMRYIDTATELEFIAEGPESDFFIVNCESGGGERVATSDDNNVYAELENFNINSSNQVTFDFRVYGTSSGLTGTLYYNVNGETPDTLGTLVAVSGGSASISGGTIITITADDGSTLYSATWNSSGDGAIPSSSQIELRLT